MTERLVVLAGHKVVVRRPTIGDSMVRDVVFRTLLSRIEEYEQSLAYRFAQVVSMSEVPENFVWTPPRLGDADDVVRSYEEWKELDGAIGEAWVNMIMTVTAPTEEPELIPEPDPKEETS